MLASAAISCADDWPRWGAIPRPQHYAPRQASEQLSTPASQAHSRSRSRHDQERQVGRQLGSPDLWQPRRRQRQSLCRTNNASPRDPKYKTTPPASTPSTNTTENSSGSSLPKLASAKSTTGKYLGILASPCVEGGQGLSRHQPLRSRVPRCRRPEATQPGLPRTKPSTRCAPASRPSRPAHRCRHPLALRHDG